VTSVLVRAAVTATLLAGLVGVVRQRQEAAAVRRSELPAPGPDGDLPAVAVYGPVAELLAGWVPRRPSSRLGRATAAVWAAPLTAVGIALALLAGRVPRWDPGLGAFVAAGVRGPSRVALRAVGADANTIGQVILSRRERPSPALLAHEAVHVRQAERLGAGLFAVYVWLAARYGYRDHPLERAARRGARGALSR
jgi:hypothetical protein